MRLKSKYIIPGANFLLSHHEVIIQTIRIYWRK